MAALIEVTGIVINPERMRWDDVVLVEVDCNGPLKESNKHLWDAINAAEKSRTTVEASESARGKVENCAPAGSSLPLAGDEDPFGIGNLVASLPQHITFKGPVESGELAPQRTYRFYGRLAEYKNQRTGRTEPQFHFQSFVKVRGHGQAGTVRYLMDCPHIGKAIADKLWAKFESDAVRILRECPEVAVAAIASPHFTDVKAREASAHLTTQQAMESCTIDLIDLLGGRGFPKSTAQATVREWGNKAADIIRRDPYYLMQFRGCGFLKCDKMALAMGADPARMKRQALGVWYVLASNAEGHTWMLKELVVRGLQRMIGGTECQPEAAIELARRARIIEVKDVTSPVSGTKSIWIAEGKKARQEQSVCDRVAQLMQQPPQWPELSSLVGIEKLSEHQRAGLTAATSKSIGILRGDPGTGKSFTIGVYLRALEQEFGTAAIAVCAQAGAAADRFKKDLTESGSSIVPRTIASLLGVADGGGIDGDKRDTGRWTFKHNADNPFPYRFVCLDEGSMPGTDLYASFLAACGVGTCVLIIGDINQLPPISHGAPMRDLIAAGVPCGVLSEPQRNAGTIIMACQDIKNGQRFRADTAETFDPDAVPPRNLLFSEANTPAEQIKVMCKRLDWAKARGLDWIWDCQVVVAVNAKSKLSRSAVNAILQEKLNPTGHRVDGSPFRVGDKVVCTDNDDYECEDRNAPYANDKGKCRISNGTFGCVLKVEIKRVVVKFFHPDRVIAFSRTKPFEKDGKQSARGKSSRDSSSYGIDGDTSDTDEMDGVDTKESPTGCPLELAYGCTGHKLQGSERKYVIPLIDEYPGAKRICRREWVFTGFSRGKWATNPVGKREAADAMCRTAALPDRKTFLRELLTEKLWGDL